MRTDDQHQPAAVVPRLSEAEISEIHRQVRAGYHPGATRELLAELDATRVDLARTRAEAETAHQGLRDVIDAVNRIDDATEIDTPSRLMMIDRDQWAALLSVTADVAWATNFQRAAPQSEQPAAPVDRSAEAELLALGHQPCCRLLGWLPYMGAYVGGHHPRCKTPTTPPEARSAEPTHQSWCALGRFSYSHCTCGATTPPVDRSAEAKVTDHVFVRRVCCARCAFWWQVESKRTYCERPYEEHAGSRPATTPPDHQAGDEPDGE